MKSKEIVVYAMLMAQALAVSGCRSYALLSACEEQMEEFPIELGTYDSPNEKIAPLGADDLVGSWHCEYVTRVYDYNGKPNGARYIDDPEISTVHTDRYWVDYTFSQDGTFRVKRDYWNVWFLTQHNPAPHTVERTGRWHYSDGKLRVVFDGGIGDRSFYKRAKDWKYCVGFYANFQFYRTICDCEYVVDWFSDGGMLLRIDDMSVFPQTSDCTASITYDQFGREYCVCRITKKVENGNSYGWIRAQATSSMVFHKVK